MHGLFQRWAVDARFVSTVFLLSLFGVAMVYSAGAINTPDPVVTEAWRRQALWLAIAMVGFTVVSRIHLRWWEWSATPAYVFALVLLAATLVIGTGGTGTAEGTKSWIDLGPVRFQPSEFAKLATVLGSCRPRTSHPPASATYSLRAFWSRLPSVS